MGFFGKLFTLIRGFFIRAGDDMVAGSPEAIRSTYAAAISDSQRRYKDLETAVALLARERERTEERLKDLDREELELTRKLEGALSAAEAQPSDPSHREAGIRYQTRIQEIDEIQLKLTQELEGQRNKVEEYKLKLRGFKEEIDRLKREQGEMVAEYVSNQQVIMLEDRLKGLGDTVVDQSVVAIREKVAGLKAQAKIASEMNSASLGSQDKAYEQIGAQTQAAQKFDDLLKARQQTKEGTKAKTRDLG
jgi:phage shock protein A